MTKKNRAPAPRKPAVVINVTDIAFGGDGIARQDGKVLFIEHAVPGETVEAEILQDKKRFVRARALRVIEAAHDAAKPFCPVFGSCGGCDWQHVPYAKQLQWKAAFIKSALFKNARYEHPDAIVVRPSPSEQNYRNRVKLKTRLTAQNGLEFGFFAKGSHAPVFVDHCPIADPSVNAFLDRLKSFRFARNRTWQGDMEVQAIAGGKRLVHFMPDFPEGALSELIKAFPDDCFQPEGSLLFEESEGLRYATQAGQFQQVNVPGNHQLRAWIAAKVSAIKPRTLLDLFCGSGNLSLSLISSDTRVWGLELAGRAIETAAVNLEVNRLTNAIYRNGPVNELHSIFADLPEELDCVITDPSRQGMDGSLDALLRLKPKHILSVSCDPNTFARDLKEILERGYIVRELFGMDFFPQTYHIETIAHLERVDD